MVGICLCRLRMVIFEMDTSNILSEDDWNLFFEEAPPKSILYLDDGKKTLILSFKDETVMLSQRII